MVVSTGDGRTIETNKPEDRKDDEPIVKVYPPSSSSSDSGSDGGGSKNKPQVDVKSLFDKLLDRFLPNKDHIAIIDIQTGLDIAGWIPIIGDIADLGNAAIYAIQGDYANAGLSLICLIPVAGDAIGKSGKVIKAAIKNSDDLAAVVKLLVKNSDKLDELADGAKAAGKIGKTGPKPFGTGPHNKKIAEVAAQIKDGRIRAGGQTDLPERLIPTSGGVKSGRRPDILVERPDGSLYGINVGKTTSNGAPIKREAQALNDLEGPGGLEMHFVPYR